MAVKLQESVRCNQIASAALEMVQDGGFESITCRDVAIKCGCSYNTVVRLFKNRRNLSIAVIDQADSRPRVSLWPRAGRTESIRSSISS